MTRRRTAPVRASAPGVAVAPPRAPAQPGIVASFSCPRCCCQDEVRLPCPEEIPCWGDKCGGPMRRWHPRYEPPIGNARVWDGQARKA